MTQTFGLISQFPPYHKRQNKVAGLDLDGKPPHLGLLRCCGPQLSAQDLLEDIREEADGDEQGDAQPGRPTGQHVYKYVVHPLITEEWPAQETGTGETLPARRRPQPHAASHTLPGGHLSRSTMLGTGSSWAHPLPVCLPVCCESASQVLQVGKGGRSHGISSQRETGQDKTQMGKGDPDLAMSTSTWCCSAGQQALWLTEAWAAK